MKIKETTLPGVFIIEAKAFSDHRGVFVKTFHEETFKPYNLDINFKESFYSISNKNVIRGMHFHLPPKDHAKLVYVTSGSVIDVVLDLRKDSPTFGEHEAIKVSQENSLMVYIPKGCAHGFLSLEDNTCMVYLQTGMYSPEHDTGIHIHDFGMNWGVTEPIISKRDLDFMTLKNFNSPF